MNKVKPKTLLHLAIAAVLISGVIGYVQYQKLSTLDGEVKGTQSQLLSKAEIEKNLATSQTQLQNDQNQLSHLEANVSSYSYVPSLLLDLDHYGRSCGLQVTGVRPKPPTSNADAAKQAAKKPYDELQIDVSGQGTYASLQKFVNGLSKFPKIVAAYAITIHPHPNTDPQAQSEPSNLLTVTVTLNTYIFKANGSNASAGNGTQNPSNPATAMAPLWQKSSSRIGGKLG